MQNIKIEEIYIGGVKVECSDELIDIEIEQRISPKINVSFEIKPIVIRIRIDKRTRNAIKKLQMKLHFKLKHKHNETIFKER